MSLTSLNRTKKPTNLLKRKINTTTIRELTLEYKSRIGNTFRCICAWVDSQESTKWKVTIF